MMIGSCFKLRHVRKDDVETLIGLLNHPDTKGDYLSLELILPGVVEKLFDDEFLSKETRETFLIIDEHDAIIGRVFHFKSVPYFNAREIGYCMFSTAHRGKGIMQEAVHLITSYVFNTSLVNRLEIHMHVENIASEKVAIACGYFKEGVMRGAVFNRGKHIDVKLYALLRSEWEILQNDS